MVVYRTSTELSTFHRVVAAWFATDTDMSSVRDLKKSLYTNSTLEIARSNIPRDVLVLVHA